MRRPITLGQEISAWVAQLDFGLKAVQTALAGLYDLAIGGTAVGTGLNAHPRFGDLAAQQIAAVDRIPLPSASNKFFSPGRPRRPGAGLGQRCAPWPAG